MAQIYIFILLLGAIDVALLSPMQTDDFVTKKVERKRRSNLAQALKLPGISDLLAEASDITSFEISGCLVELSKTECEFGLKPSGDNCPEGLTLEAIVDHFFPQSNLKRNSRAFLVPSKFKIDAIKIDKCEGTISLSCQSTDKLVVIPRRFFIDEAELTLEFNFRSGSIAWNKLGIKISGTATVGNKKVETSLVKNAGEREISFSLTVDEISITDFIALFTRSKAEGKVEATASADLIDEEELDEAVNSTSTKGVLIQSSLSKLNECRKSLALKRSDDEVEDPSVSTESLTGLTIEKPTFSGKFVPRGPFEFLISGLPKADFFKGTVFAIVDRNRKRKVKIAVVASIENFSPAALLSKLTKKDLSSIPLLKDITLNFAASVANAKLSDIENEELANVLKAFGDNSDTIDKGIVLKVELPIKDVIEKMNPGTDVDVPDSLYLQAKIAGGKVKMSFPETWQTDLLKILSALTPKAIELLPDWLRGEGPGKIELKKLDFDYVEKVFSVQVTAAGPINIKDVFSISDVNIEITHDYKEKNWDFKLESTQKLFDEVTLTVSIAKEGQNFKVSGTIDEISILQIARWLKAEFVNKSFLQKYSFLDFGVQDFQVEAEFGGGDLSLRISGTAILGGWRGLSLEGILFRKEGKNLLAVGVLFNKVRLDEILDSLFKTRVQFISWMGELNLALAVSTANGGEGDTGFSLEGLEDMKIEKGFQFRAEFQAPSDCEDEFCKQAKEIMGDNKVILAGQVTTGSFIFTAAVQGDWKIGSNVIITNISLVIEVSSDGKIYFAVNVKLVKPALEFEGSIGIGLKGNVELSAKMVGMWEKPFGLAYLSFGDVFLTVGLYVGVLLPYLEFGGRIVVGKIGNGKEIKAEGAIGLDPVTPTKNYFYANVNQLTIGKIAEAFELSTNMPSLIANTGFPEGLVVSFTTNPQGKMIDALNVEIPFGFAFKGTIQIDTYKVKCDIKLNLPSYFEIKVDMDPLTLANGALKLFRSQRNKKQGPLIYGKISTEEVKVHIAGFIHILGIETEVEIKVNNQEFYFHIVGKIFNIIQASLDVKAKYESFAEMEFEAKACIGSAVADDINKEFEKIKKEQTGSMKSVRSDAKELLKEVMRLQRAARKTKLDRRSELQKCYSQFQNATGSFSAGDTLEQTDCTAKCRGACLGSSDWNSSCSHLEGGSVGCPSWNSCKFKALNETCYAACKKNEVLNRIKTGIKRGFWSWLWGKIKKGFQEVGKKVVEGAKWLGNKIKEGLEWTWNQIKKILKLFINVKKACLSGSLSMIAKKACVGIDVSVEILQMTTFNVNFELCLDAGFVRKIAEYIFGVAAKPIKEYKSRVYDLRRYMAKMEVYRGALATAIKEQRVEEVYSDEDYLEDEMLPAEDETAMQEGPGELTSTHGNQFQRYTLLESGYVEEKRDRPGHKFVEGYEPLAQVYIPAARRSHLNAQVTSNKALETESPCKRMKLAVRGYQSVAGNLQNLVDQYNRERNQFEVTRRDEVSKLKQMKRDLDKDCHRVGCSAAEYKDVISVMKSAKEGHRQWVKAVESQLNVQNRDSIKIWRRTLNNVFINNKGYDAMQHLRNLDQISSTASKKMSIADRDNDKHAASSAYVSKVLKDIVLTKRDMSLNDVATRLAKINPHLAFLKSNSESC